MAPLSFSSLFLVLWLPALLLFPAPTRASLSAYYSFDAPNQLGGVSGYCPNVVPQGELNGGSIVTSSCKYGSCIKGSFNARNVKIFQGKDSSQLSISMWLGTPGSLSSTYQIVSKPGMIGISYVQSCLLILCSYSATFRFNPQRSVSVDTGKSLATNRLYYIAAIYDSTQLCVYVNQEKWVQCSHEDQKVKPSSGIFQCSSVSGIFTEDSATSLVIGGSWPGTIDEFKIYDQALTDNQRAALYSSVNTNDVPTVSLDIGGISYTSVFSAPALTNVTAKGNVVDARQAFSGAAQQGNYASNFIYSWEVVSSKCGIVDLPVAAGQNIGLSLLSVGQFTIRLCASDGELANEIVILSFVTASQPIIERETQSGNVSIPEGAVNYPITVFASAIPPPSYQWQKLVMVEKNVSNSTDAVTSMASFQYEWEQHVYERDFIIVDVWEFQDIEGENSNTLQINGTVELNNTVVRCIAYNGGGSVVSNNFTIQVNAAPVAPSPSPGAGGSSETDTTIIIIAASAGGGGGLLALCCLAVIVAAVVWGWKRGRSPYRKLKQPDYAAIAYGDIDREVIFPKRQADHYQTLERLLISPDMRLAHAILVSVKYQELDVACLSLLRILEFHKSAYNFVAGCISWEVADANDEATLFRANSNATKLFSHYIKMIGLKYMWHVLVLSVHSLNDNAIETFPDTESERGSSSNQQWFRPQGSKVGRYRLDTDDEEAASSSISMDLFNISSMELDPQKLEDASDVTINTLELWLVTQKMFKLIISSQKSIPRQLRMLLAHVREEVGNRFNHSAQFRAVGAFYFLRFICPALLAPQAFGLLDSPPHQVAQRQLILVSKVLQNLANDTLPGVKEACMEQLNAFIVTNKPVLESFYDSIAAEANTGKIVDTDVPLNVKNDALLKMHKIIVANLPLIEQALRDDGGDEDVIHALNYVLKEMGDLDGEGKNISVEDLGSFDL